MTHDFSGDNDYYCVRCGVDANNAVDFACVSPTTEDRGGDANERDRTRPKQQNDPDVSVGRGSVEPHADPVEGPAAVGILRASPAVERRRR